MPSGRKKRLAAKRARRDGCQARENPEGLRVETEKDASSEFCEKRDDEVLTPKTPVQESESDEMDTPSQTVESAKLSSFDDEESPSQAFELKTESAAGAEENSSLLASSGSLEDGKTVPHLPYLERQDSIPEGREEVVLLEAGGKAGDANLQFGDSDPCFLQGNLERFEVSERELDESVSEAVGVTDGVKPAVVQLCASSGADDNEPVTAKSNTSSDTDGQISVPLLEDATWCVELGQSSQLSKDAILDWKSVTQLANTERHDDVRQARHKGKPEEKEDHFSLQFSDSEEPYLCQVIQEGYETSELVLDQSVPEAVGVRDGGLHNTQADDHETVEADANTSSNTDEKTSEPLLEEASFSLELRKSSQFSNDTNLVSEEDPNDGTERRDTSTPEEAQLYTPSSIEEPVLLVSRLRQVHGDTVLNLSRQMDDDLIAVVSGGDSETIFSDDTNCHDVLDTTVHETEYFSGCNILANGGLEDIASVREVHTESLLPDVFPFEASGEAVGVDDILCPEYSLRVSAANVDARETTFQGQSTPATVKGEPAVFGGVANAVQGTIIVVSEAAREETPGDILVDEDRNGGSAVLKDPTFMTGASESESIKADDREGASGECVSTGNESTVDAELSQENVKKSFSKHCLIGHVMKNAEMNVEETPGFVHQELKNEQEDNKSEETLQENAMQSSSDIAGEEGKPTPEVEDLEVVTSERVLESTQLVDTQKEDPSHCCLLTNTKESDDVNERKVEQQVTVTSWKGCCGVLDWLLGRQE
eukprot:c28998_g1_i1 orf=194-2491(+)